MLYVTVWELRWNLVIWYYQHVCGSANCLRSMNSFSVCRTETLTGCGRTRTRRWSSPSLSCAPVVSGVWLALTCVVPANTWVQTQLSGIEQHYELADSPDSWWWIIESLVVSPGDLECYSLRARLLFCLKQHVSEGKVCHADGAVQEAGRVFK